MIKYRMLLVLISHRTESKKRNTYNFIPPRWLFLSFIFDYYLCDFLFCLFKTNNTQIRLEQIGLVFYYSLFYKLVVVFCFNREMTGYDVLRCSVIVSSNSNSSNKYFVFELECWTFKLMQNRSFETHNRSMQYCK